MKYVHVSDKSKGEQFGTILVSMNLQVHFFVFKLNILDDSNIFLEFQEPKNIISRSRSKTTL